MLERHVRGMRDGAILVPRGRLGGTFAGTPFAGTYRYTRDRQHKPERWLRACGELTRA